LRRTWSRLPQFPAELREKVMAEYPRMNFKQDIAKALHDMTNTDLIDDLEDEEHLFAQISAGHHDGQVIADIGWAAFQFRDQLL
jgi:hypothetical protein